MSRQFFLAAALAMSASVAQAADPAPSPFACKQDGNQQEMNACADQDFAAADKRLNTTYQGLMETAAASRQQQLRTAQREWLKHRDPTCKSRAKAYQGGSMQPMVYQSCRTELTNERIEVLDTMNQKK